jgi:hypothetical protein
MTNGRCRMHGGKAPGAAKGNRNALKHGRYTAEAIGERRHLMALVRDMKALPSRWTARNRPLGNLFPMRAGR